MADAPAVFDAVSCQFALHYAFESAQAADVALANAASRLREGGFFFGTTTDAQSIRRQVSAARTGATLSNSLFCLSFPPPPPGSGDGRAHILRDDFGVRYTFTLEDAVEACPEFLVPLAVLTRIAARHGLVVHEILPFADFYGKYSRVPKYERQLHRMHVVSPDGAFLTDEERAVAELYIVFCFRKVRGP